MKVVICGANGAMGKLLQEKFGKSVVGLVSADGLNGVPRSFAELGDVQADLVVDFSHHTAAPEVAKYATETGCAMVVGTTAHTEEEKAAIYAASKSVPVFYAGNMSLGVAVLCNLAKQTAQSFPDADIEIVEIHGKSPNKSFTVRITDPALLEKTGGIVQGMSGSPIIQNGKLVGALTHVMLDDPKMGYGIFIENMLNQINAPKK